MLHYYNIGKHTVQVCRTGDRIATTIGYLVDTDKSNWEFDSLGLIFTQEELQQILNKLACSNKNKPKIPYKILPAKNDGKYVCDDDDEK